MLFFILITTGFVIAQNDELAPVTRTIAFTNVNIIPSPGQIIENGIVVVRNGVITAVGKNAVVPPGAKVVKADSMYLYAGFILGMSNAGVKMPEQKDRPEVKEPANPPDELAGITPERNVLDYISPDDKSISELRGLGFTLAQTAPDGGMLPGMASVILLSGNQRDDLLLKSNTALYATFDGARRMYPATVIGVMAKFRELYRQAEQSKRFQNQYTSSPAGMERPQYDRTLEAFYPVVDKRIPVIFEGKEVLEAQRALTLQRELGFNLVLTELKQGWDIVDQLKGSNTKVLFSLDLPEWKEEKKDSTKEDSSKEPKIAESSGEAEKDTVESQEKKMLESRKEEFAKKAFGQMAAYHKAGVMFGFSSVEVKSGDIHKNLVKIVENGLSEDAALAALTTTPASFLGLSQVAGTVENGKMANMVISTKPYFDKESKVKYVVIDGVLFEYEIKEGKKSDPKTVAAAVGTWRYSSESPQGTVTGNLVLMESGGILSGTISNSATNETSPLKDVIFVGNKLSFTFTVDAGGEALEINAVVTVDADKFNGTVSISNEPFAIEGTRDPQNKK